MLLIVSNLQQEQDTMMLRLYRAGRGSCGVILRGQVGKVDGLQ